MSTSTWFPIASNLVLSSALILARAAEPDPDDTVLDLRNVKASTSDVREIGEIQGRVRGLRQVWRR